MEEYEEYKNRLEMIKRQSSPPMSLPVAIVMAVVMAVVISVVVFFHSALIINCR